MLWLKLIHVSQGGPRNSVSTHWGRDKIANISQTTYSNAFSRMKIYEFLLTISLKIVPKVRMNNIAASVQIMVWRRPGNRPVSEPMIVNLLTHICATRPQWVNCWRPVWMCASHSYLRINVTYKRYPYAIHNDLLYYSVLQEIHFVLVRSHCRFNLY